MNHCQVIKPIMCYGYLSKNTKMVSLTNYHNEIEIYFRKMEVQFLLNSPVVVCGDSSWRRRVKFLVIL